MTKGFKAIGIIALLLLAAVVVILGMMVNQVPQAPPIIDVNIPDNPITVENAFMPEIDIIVDPCIEAIIGQSGPRYDKETVEAIMRNRVYPWPPLSFKVTHHEGRIWHVVVRFQRFSRLYIFDEPL